MDYLLNKVISFKFSLKSIILNLIINGLPSKLYKNKYKIQGVMTNDFKPYYKWITF